MTGEEMMNRAMTILGYTDTNGSSQTANRAKTRALIVINEVFHDLLFVLGAETADIEKLTDNIVFPPGTDSRVLNDMMPYGVAAMFAQGDGDGDNQVFCASIYNKRRTSLSRLETIKEVVPKVCD